MSMTAANSTIDLFDGPANDHADSRHFSLVRWLIGTQTKAAERSLETVAVKRRALPNDNAEYLRDLW